MARLDGPEQRGFAPVGGAEPRELLEPIYNEELRRLEPNEAASLVNRDLARGPLAHS